MRNKPQKISSLNDTHLYTPVLYQAGDGTWHEDFFEAVKKTPGPLNWDPVAILSILSFNYSCGDRTLIEQISRKPWLSSIQDSGKTELLPIPSHGWEGVSAKDAAANLETLLCDEIANACKNREQIYILLSGGLDSRVVAGIVSKLEKEGRINASISAVTWGVKNCRDIKYGQAIADSLGFNWIQLGLGREHLIENIGYAAEHTAGLISPVHLHRMAWSKTVDKNALFLAGSYGDMVGRAVFSGSHVLEMQPHRPRNRHGLLTKEAYFVASQGLSDVIRSLRDRSGDRPEYALCEIEGHGHYTRGLLAQAMNLINRNCSIYQAFTDQSVYKYMWSLHPSFRTDDIYAQLLLRLHPHIAQVPWSRTNKAASGPTIGADPTLVSKFHNYPDWISNRSFSKICRYIEPEWFENTGVFSGTAVKKLSEVVRKGQATQEGCAIFAWLASIRRFADLLENVGKSPVANDTSAFSKMDSFDSLSCRDNKRGHQSTMGYTMFVRKIDEYTKPVKKWLLRRNAIKKYPPNFN